MSKKYSLTNNTIEYAGRTLFQIKAEMSFGSIVKGELGGYIEKEENLAQVSGNAWVYGNACVYGDAWVSAKMSFIKGWFIGGDDTGKITDITDKTGSTYWKNQYVLGDYKITPIDEEKKEPETLKIGNQTYNKNEVETALKNIKPLSS